MTKEISKEVIAKVFWLYPGAEVLAPDKWGSNPDDKRKGYLTGIHGEYQAEIQFMEDDGINVFEDPNYEEYNNCQLILFDLSDMSEEDANHVCRIVNFSIDIEDLPHGDHKEYFLNRLMRHIDNDELNFSTADFLRSRDYMLPAHGIQDLFEAGIAVRKNKEV